MWGTAIVSRLFPQRSGEAEESDGGLSNPLKGRVSLTWRVIPPLFLLTLIAGVVAFAVLWDLPYLLAPAGAALGCDAYFFYVSITLPILKSFSKNNLAYEAENQRLASENQKLADTRVHLEGEVEVFKNENHSLHENVKDLKGQTDLLRTDIDELNHQNSRLKKRVESLISLENRLREDLENNQQAVAQQITDLQKLNEGLTQILTLSSEDHAKFTTTVNSFRESMQNLTKLDSEHAELYTRLKETSDLLNGIFKTIASWKEVDTTIKKKLNKMKRFQRQLNGVKKELLRVSTLLEAKTGELEVQTKELERVRGALGEEVSRFKEQNKVLSITCDRFTSKADTGA